MTDHRVAVIGTGGIANRHAVTWRAMDDVELVACADLVRERAESYAGEHGIDPGGVYEDYGEMVRETDPDVVSVCTPESTHEEIVIDVARIGVPAIHCEKAVADTWGGAVRVARDCDRRGVQLTFNHQRRFGRPWRDAKALLDDGEIGDLERMEFSFADLYTYGTHQIDTFGYWNDDRPAEWVLGQIDYHEENVHRGTHVENQAFACWEYDNGVYGVVSTGPGRGLVGSYSRLDGTEGVIRLRKHHDGPLAYSLDVRRADDADWTTTEYEETDAWVRSFRSVLDALESGERPALGAKNALQTTEIIFAVYESSRRRGRVDLPLDVYDNPLESMVETGALAPEPAEER